jgi:hypothetical protein
MRFDQAAQPFGGSVSPVEKWATLPAVVATLFDSSKPSNIDDPIASFELELTDEEIASVHASGSASQLIPGGFGITNPARRVTLRVRHGRLEFPRRPEMVCDLVTRDTAGSESTAAGLKREQHQPSCWSCDVSESLGVSLALAVGKAMQAPAVDKEFMTIPDSERLQASDVTLHPVDTDAARPRAAPGCLQRSRDAIDARDRPSAPSQVDGIATCPAADVQGPTWRRILFADFDEGRGNSVALPRRDAQPVQNTVGIHRLHGNRFMARPPPPLVRRSRRVDPRQDLA